jgi:hypothetical protein
VCKYSLARAGLALDQQGLFERDRYVDRTLKFFCRDIVIRSFEK